LIEHLDFGGSTQRRHLHHREDGGRGGVDPGKEAGASPGGTGAS
jgi:hypothetical protein